ncbi:MAG: bifunctional tetrahydrofolate synthase/dihydrofolate synthase [Burkholderiales bacterium]|nr:bifunctional tetrahydrofolate synthase/dihydrofolate synthase [Nitrosomonas sp.]MCP5273738.1 bifunctional tetrahydrofolate synthase/dihydrofolate synthase [Burkholderiales bacterium]
MHPDPTGNSLKGWLAYLEQLHSKTIDLGLERVDRVRAELGLTPFFPVITVGGTNGKGSVCAILESILTAAGYRVGCYTSPHLVSFNERIRIQQKEVVDEQLLLAFTLIEQARKKSGISLTYFEFVTLTAMHLFIAEHVDVAILEVGLGGRLDAVNIFDADCAILTSVDLDHQDYLGDSREAIGYEKAGIFRKNKPAVCAEVELPAGVKQYAQKINAKLNLIGQDFGFVQKDGQWDFWSQKGWCHTLPLPAVRGLKQLENASVCLMTIEMLCEQLPVNIQAIRQGLINVLLPGRFQVLSCQPMIVLDVAHNPAAALVLAKNLEMTQPSGKTFAIIAMLKDKDISGVIQALKNHVNVWLLSPIDASRGASTHELLQNLYKLNITPDNHIIHEFEDIITAYSFACEHADKSDRICVLGSFYTVGAVLRDQQKVNGQ